MLKVAKKSFTDAITYSQPLMKEISEGESKDALQDPNLSQILTILKERNHPMTVTELEEAFKAIKKERSSKTIYRYLKKLENSGLVVQAGKRVFSDPNAKLRTQTLYQRSAKFHFPINTPIEIKQRKKGIFKVVGELLENLFDKPVKSPELLDDLLADMFVRESQLIRKLLENIDEKCIESMVDWNYKQLQTIILILGRLVLYYDHDEWNKRFHTCFSE